MKNIRRSSNNIIFIFSFIILFSSCSSTTVIQSDPSGAKLFIDDEYKGLTPYTYKDSKIVGSTIALRIEKENYSTLFSTIEKNEEINVVPLIGGIFFLVPWLWLMKYKPTHNYQLKKISNTNKKDSTKSILNNSKYTELIELKKLLDKGIISREEFDIEKKKILSKD